MSAILAFILFLLMAVLAVFAFLFFFAYSTLRRALEGFRALFHGDSATGGNGQRAPKDPTVRDTRTPQRANQKIFSKDEGEYVEFEEIK